MEDSEISLIEGVNNRKYVITKICWLSNSKFEELINIHKLKNSLLEINPCLNENDDIHSRLFIGKTKPIYLHQSHEGNLNIINRNDSEIHKYTELIGNVFYSFDKKWKLKVTYQGRSIEIEDNFLILNIPDRNSYFWCSNVDISNPTQLVFNQKELPKFAFRAAVDKMNCKYSYVGRTLSDDEDRPKFYSNAWLKFSKNIERTFGKVCKSHKLLYSSYQDLEIGFDQFETLCLKVTPASLKILCRTALRYYLNYSQSKIVSINNDSLNQIPRSLVNYLKYPSCLKIGELLLRDEKLVDENNCYELAFDYLTGNLICKNLHDKNKQTYLSVVAYGVDSIILQPFDVIFFNSKDLKVVNVHSIYDNLPFRLYLDWEKTCFKIEVFK